MHTIRRRVPGIVALTALLAAAAVPVPAVADSTPYTVRTLHFDVETGGGHRCDIVGDLYTPTGASRARPVPAILTTNGFGGSKDDQAGIGRTFATRGYAVLSYSGLGFGGSGCKITLDDPDTDGRAASQLVSFLGGGNGIAYTDAAHTAAVPGLTVIRHDDTDHAGHRQRYDPRVGMVGGSYGGAIQFATASVDPRVDTIVPLITWNDLSYSLAPNNADLTAGVTSSTPGSAKITWALLFTLEGALLDSASGFTYDPTRVIGCPNFTDQVCPGLTATGVAGYPQPDTTAFLRHASVQSYASRVRVPTLLVQGENDTLFNLNEAVATYRAFQAQGTPVQMIWQSWGHSGSTPAPGEIDLANPDPATQYETGRIADWFDHYLRGSAVSTGPGFSYFRDWVSYHGNAAPAYGSAPSYPVGHRSTLRLSGGGALVAGAVTPGSQTFVTPPAGVPTSSSGIDAVSPGVPGDLNLPGTYAQWTGAALRAPVDVVGAPELTVRLTAPTAAVSQHLGPAGQLVLFAKVYDVAPDGTESLVHNLVAPARISDVTRPVHVVLPAIAHRFGTGHQLRLVIGSGDLNYRGGLASAPVTIDAGTAQTLTLPVL